jgi:plastocyanin
MQRIFTTLVALALSAPAVAASLGVHVADAGGKPVRDAVVTLRPVGRPAPLPAPARGLAVEQRNLMFHPFVTIVPVGSSVAFPNFDATRHHVYSFSAPKRFEFKLFARDQSRSVTLDRPGTVAVGCNIHDKMSAFLFVTDTAWTAKTDAAGNVLFRDAPAGAVTVGIWHPYLRSPDGSVSRQVALGGAARVEAFSVRLRSPPMHDMSGY